MARFKLLVSTVDGKILENPYYEWFDCCCIRSIGRQVVKQYNSSECIVARDVFLVFYGGHLFGTREFLDEAGYVAYLLEANCVSDDSPCKHITYKCCRVTYKGKAITL